MLSAVSKQILTIQTGLQEQTAKVELHLSQIKLNLVMSIFVTMNPGYAGKSNLPDNLKQPFRQVAMIKPNREINIRVMLYFQDSKLQRNSLERSLVYLNSAVINNQISLTTISYWEHIKVYLLVHEISKVY